MPFQLKYANSLESVLMLCLMATKYDRYIHLKKRILRAQTRMMITIVLSFFDKNKYKIRKIKTILREKEEVIIYFSFGV